MLWFDLVDYLVHLRLCRRQSTDSAQKRGSNDLLHSRENDIVLNR